MPALPPLHHVGIVVADMRAASADFERRWGTPTVGLHEASWAGAVVDGNRTTFSATYGFIRTCSAQIELIEPSAGHSPYADFLDAHGEGVHHLTYMVDAIDPFLAELLGSDDHLSLQLDARIPPLGRFVYLDSAAHGPAVALIELPS
jgi:catechol 2,3-dioxygenase-like lactoylglutathione lyase family enzyme